MSENWKCITPPPKYFLEIKDANHFSFNNRFTHRRSARRLSGTEEQFEVIRKYSIAFLEKHVARKVNQDTILEQQDALLTRYLKAPYLNINCEVHQ